MTYSTTHDPGSFFPVGSTIVEYTARDGAGNEATCEFRLNVLG